MPTWEILIQVGLGQDLAIILSTLPGNSDPFFQGIFLAFLPWAGTILSAGDKSQKGLQSSHTKKTFGERVNRVH